ncbi:uncharacterized protein DDB_G0287625-like isoform X2 [Eurosta solidaginis]|uniref:uncharacterized protein DDB_G0287625-like isoform X2 n=1 Tax=Eurosta solidaginis TaxID=178769 RepID=UPI003530EC58
MASDMDKYLDMSLDEYIATKKVEQHKNNNNGNKSCGDSKNTVSTFKAERRHSKIPPDVDEDELMDNESELLGEETLKDSSDVLNKSFGIWRGPSAETNYIDLDYMRDEFDEMFHDPELQRKPCEEKQFAKTQQHQQQTPQKDLRERLNNSNLNTLNNNNCSTTKKQYEQLVHAANKQNMNASKQNINSMKQNNMNINKQHNMNMNKHNNMNANKDRWSNIQQSQQQSLSLTSLNTDGGMNGNGQYRRRWNNYNNRNFRRRNNDGCGNGRGGFGGGIMNSNQSLYWNNRNEGMNCNMLPINSNGRIQRVNQQRYNDDALKQTGSVRDLTIECPNISVRGRITGAAGALQQAAATHQQLQPQSSTAPTQNDLKALLGVNESNLKAETMAMWAGKLLDLFQSGQQQTIHKPIYDMQVQKEIHNLQGKSLLYKCPSGEVVSSDGTGIDNCKITPNSSGVTLNYRFG